LLVPRAPSANEAKEPDKGRAVETTEQKFSKKITKAALAWSPGWMAHCGGLTPLTY